MAYPKFQFQCSELPEDEKYPGRLFFIIPTYVKIYTLFHLHHQKRDAHRRSGDDKTKREPFLDYLIPKLEMAFSYAVLLLVAINIIGTKSG